MNRPGEPGFAESLPNLTDSLSRIILTSTEVTWAADEEQVQAWRFRTAQNDTGIVKRWSAERVAATGTQTGAEMRASAVLGAVLDEPSPLMAPLLEQTAYPRGSVLSVYPYAGVSADQMLNKEWVTFTPQEREPLCQKLAISALRAFEILERVPAKYGGPKLHRDGKLSNWCWNEEGEFFVCIDFGGFCSTNLADWHAVVSAKYLDCCFARITTGPGANSPPVRVIEDIEEWRRHTTRSLDLYLLALAIIELYLGDLPAAINYDQYGPEELEEYLQSVCDCQWEDCPDLADAPREMVDFLLWCTAPDPANRPPSATAALQHEWIAGHVAAVDQAVAEAAPAWAATNRRLREALAGSEAAPAQTDETDDSSDDSSSCDGNSCRLDEIDASSASGHVWSSHGTSGGSSTRSSITSSEWYDAGCQQQDPAAASSNSSNEASNYSVADCTVFVRREHPKPGYSISRGDGMLCTNTSAASHTGGAKEARSGGILVGASELLLPPMVRSSSSSADAEGPSELLALPQRHRDACSDAAYHEQGSALLWAAAAVAPHRPLQQQQHKRQSSRSSIPVSTSNQLLPPLVRSSPSSSDTELYRNDVQHPQRLQQPQLVSHPLQWHRTRPRPRHSHNPCKWALRHLLHTARHVGCQLSRLVKVPARQK